jgi:hypothetical protein
MLRKRNKTNTKAMCRHNTKRTHMEIHKHDPYGPMHARNNKTT